MDRRFPGPDRSQTGSRPSTVVQVLRGGWSNVPRRRGGDGPGTAATCGGSDRRIVRTSSSVSLIRADGVQQRHRWLAVPFAVNKRFGEHDGTRLAATVSYYSFFSVFPLLLVFVTILGLVLDDDPELRQDLVDGALGQVPVLGDQLASNTGLQGSVLGPGHRHRHRPVGGHGRSGRAATGSRRRRRRVDAPAAELRAEAPPRHPVPARRRPGHRGLGHPVQPGDVVRHRARSPAPSACWRRSSSTSASCWRRSRCCRRSGGRSGSCCPAR